MTLNIRKLPLFLAAIAAAAPLSAQTAAELVPETIKERGYIEIVTDPSFGPPWNYHPEDAPETIAGINADIGAGMAEKMGIDVNFVSLGWAGIIPALRADRYDATMVGMFATEERVEIIDLVTYAVDASAILVQEGNPLDIQDLPDLCGKTVAAVTGTLQIAMVEDQNALCDEPIDIRGLPTATDAFLQITSKRADATINGYIVSGYLTESGVLAEQGIEAVFNGGVNRRPLGIGMPKGREELRGAIQAAINEMIEDGSYQEIFAKWGSPDMPLEEAEINVYTVAD